jgi:hypothetical protein
VLYVSHDLGSVTRLCRRAIWLEEGRLRADGPAAELVAAYLKTAAAGKPLSTELENEPGGAVQLTTVQVKGPFGEVLTAPRRDQPFVIELGLVLRERIPALDLAVTLIDQKGVRVLSDVRSDWVEGDEFGENPGSYRISAAIPPILAAGVYALEVWIGNAHDELFFMREVLSIRVMPLEHDAKHAVERQRVVHPRVRWEIQAESTDLGSQS